MELVDEKYSENKRRESAWREIEKDKVEMKHAVRLSVFFIVREGSGA